ncbi:hypothetical protein LCGC14_1481540, partial [marine sediment metagenome]
PQILTWSFGLNIGQRGFLRAQVTRKDGRLSSDVRLFQVVA